MLVTALSSPRGMSHLFDLRPLFGGSSGRGERDGGLLPWRARPRRPPFISRRACVSQIVRDPEFLRRLVDRRLLVGGVDVAQVAGRRSVTRHSCTRSRGFVFLALAIYLLPVVVAGDAVIPGAGDLAIHSSHDKSRATPKTSNTVARRRMSVGSSSCQWSAGPSRQTTHTRRALRLAPRRLAVHPMLAHTWVAGGRSPQAQERGAHVKRPLDRRLRV